ncbi:MAG TPA: hypothetical protein VIF15_08205, partial [Polyangiaceae bacterium]
MIRPEKVALQIRNADNAQTHDRSCDAGAGGPRLDGSESTRILDPRRPPSARVVLAYRWRHDR